VVSTVSDEALFSRLAEVLKSGKAVALVTIVEKVGSGPRGVGAKMAVTEDGEVIGTVGGGSFERMVVNEALKRIREGKPGIVKYSFVGKEVEGAIDTGLICGGTVSVFIDIIKPRIKVLVFGAGKIGKPLAHLLDMVGFRVVVADPDPKLVGREDYPFAEELIGGGLRDIISKLKNIVSEKDIVLVTHGDPEVDYLAVKEFLGKSLFVGLLGSRRKVTEFVKRLVNEGIDKETIVKYLRGPIGLDIGAKTPEEIALSIVAELIALIKGVEPKSLNIIPKLIFQK